MILRISTTTTAEYTLTPCSRWTTQEVCARLRDGRAVKREAKFAAPYVVIPETETVIATLERLPDPAAKVHISFTP